MFTLILVYVLIYRQNVVVQSIWIIALQLIYLEMSSNYCFEQNILQLYNLYVCFCVILNLFIDEGDAIVPSLPSLPPPDPKGTIYQ